MISKNIFGVDIEEWLQLDMKLFKVLCWVLRKTEQKHLQSPCCPQLNGEPDIKQKFLCLKKGYASFVDDNHHTLPYKMPST